MNAQNHDELERMLGRELHGRADGLHGSPLGLADVKGRASRIRRTRRVVAGGVVAAALAVVVPTVMTLGGPVSESQREIEPAPSPDTPTEVARTTLTLDGLERGDDPAIEFFTPDGVVLPGQGLVELDASYQALVENPADGGWIAIEPDGQSIRYLSQDFEPQGGSSGTTGLVTSADREWVAWVAPEPGAQTLQVVSTTDPGAGRSWPLPESPVAEPVGFLGEDRVLYETRNPTGVSTFGVAEPDGSTSELPGWVDAQSTSEVAGLVAVQTSADDYDGGCFAVVDADAPRTTLWETCDYALGAFSPDGRYVMASDPLQDGLGPTSLSILDAATGEPVAEFTRVGRRPEVTLVSPAWEGNEAVVASALGNGEQALVRMGVDGSLEDASDRVASTDTDFHYYLGRDRAGL
ncbi:hypothetical protein ACFP3Q_07785 [Nocardioides sp. GCM10027113]|uniref:hypothetical protein n=1 Tax=unclassified Nocardioides TaxID=2615069 RepID=UPI003622B38F